MMEIEDREKDIEDSWLKINFRKTRLGEFFCSRKRKIDNFF